MALVAGTVVAGTLVVGTPLGTPAMALAAVTP